MRFIDTGNDPWHEITADDSLVAVPAAEAHALLSIAQWRAVRESWPQATPVGLALDNDVDVESVAEDLPRFALVALRFPKWVDGRAYSQARLLRVRFHFAGEIRASGEVLVDMLPLLTRTGFDAAVLRPDQSLATARRVLGAFAQGHYQGDVIEPRPLFGRVVDGVSNPAP
jgi:uncharacterized protein (DUF934 family)